MTAKPYALVPTADLVELRTAMERRPTTPELLAVTFRLSAELRRRADNGEDVATIARATRERVDALDERIAEAKKNATLTRIRIVDTP
jgi:hypothetical protein